MQRLEVSGAVRPIYGSLGVKRLSTKGEQRSRDPSVDSESFVRYLKRYDALRRLSIKQSLGQDVQRSSGESGGSSGAYLLSSFLTCNYRLLVKSIS